VSETVNCCVLTACIAELESMRYTPAGIPALNLILEHASSIEITGQAQQVKAKLKAKAFGSLAERLAGQAIGSIWKFSGHLASPRNGKQVYLHIQDIAASP
jgi:primosomal replication protein N